MADELVPAGPTSLVQAGTLPVPELVARMGQAASKRFLELFFATIRNVNTRQSYARAVRRFFDWLDEHGLEDLVDLEPLHVAAYIEGLGQEYSPPTVKQHLAAIRMCLDWMVNPRQQQ